MSFSLPPLFASIFPPYWIVARQHDNKLVSEGSIVLRILVDTFENQETVGQLNEELL